MSFNDLYAPKAASTNDIAGKPAAPPDKTPVNDPAAESKKTPVAEPATPKS